MGRPRTRLRGGHTKHQVSVRGEVYEALQARAKQEGVPMSTLVDRIVTGAMDAEERTS